MSSTEASEVLGLKDKEKIQTDEKGHLHFAFREAILIRSIHISEISGAKKFLFFWGGEYET